MSLINDDEEDVIIGAAATSVLAAGAAFVVAYENYNDIPRVNGCTGKMGRSVLEASISAGLQPVSVCFSGQFLSSVFEEHPNLIVVDYTVPAAVNDNAELYNKVGVPFVMGTTGGDREKLYKIVVDSKVYAVISPQMGKQNEGLKDDKNAEENLSLGDEGCGTRQH